MLQLTTDARDHLARVRRERRKEAASARFVPSPSGRGVSLTFAAKPDDGDKVLHADGMQVFVASAVADRLGRSVIDVGVGKNGAPCLILKSRTAVS